MATAYEIVNDLKDLPKNKNGFIEVVERYKNGRIKKITKYLAEKSADKEEVKKLCENVLNGVKELNVSADVLNKNMDVIKGLSSLNAILGAANLCATVAGFAIMKAELGKVVQNVEGLKTILQQQYQDTIEYKYDEVQGTYDRMLDKKRHNEEFGIDNLIDLVDKLHRTLNLFIKAFLKYNTQIDNNAVLTVIIALASMLSEASVYLYQEYYEKYSDEKDIEMKFYSSRQKWNDIFQKMETKEFKERLYELYFIDKDQNQYASTLAMIGVCNQFEELKYNISDKEASLRFFDSINETNLESFMKEIDAFANEQFEKELESGTYSNNIKNIFEDAKRDLQLAVA